MMNVYVVRTGEKHEASTVRGIFKSLGSARALARSFFEEMVTSWEKFSPEEEVPVEDFRLVAPDIDIVDPTLCAYGRVGCDYVDVREFKLEE